MNLLRATKQKDSLDIYPNFVAIRLPRFLVESNLSPPNTNGYFYAIRSLLMNRIYSAISSSLLRMVVMPIPARGLLRSHHSIRSLVRSAENRRLANHRPERVGRG